MASLTDRSRGSARYVQETIRPILRGRTACTDFRWLRGIPVGRRTRACYAWTWLLGANLALADSTLIYRGYPLFHQDDRPETYVKAGL